MRTLLLRGTSLRLLLVACFAGLPLTLALGHEGHHAEWLAGGRCRLSLWFYRSGYPYKFR